MWFGLVISFCIGILSCVNLVKLFSGRLIGVLLFIDICIIELFGSILMVECSVSCSLLGRV